MLGGAVLGGVATALGLLVARPAGCDQMKRNMDADETLDAEQRSANARRLLTEQRSEDQRSAEDHDLGESLTALSRLGSNRMGLEDLLTRVATYAVRAIPGADGAGLTLLEEDRADTIVATAPFVTVIDDIQYGMLQGPCVSAAAEARTVMSGSLGSDSRWPRFGGRVARLGVHSALSLPLITPDGVVGAMNVYAHDKNAFDDRAAELGELFAEPAAIAVQNAQVLAQTQRLASRLQAALETRGVIDRAVGILMSRSGGTTEEALERLRALSQHEHHKLPMVARQIIEEAVRRAEARHHSG